MSRVAKFGLFVLLVLAFLVGEITYIKQKEQNLYSKLELVRLTGLNSFAFYINTPYLRHPYNHDISDVFSYHPAFRESEMGSFINSGYEKRFKNE
ncbi:hypothetical protein [Campylobacter geochelonis]|uniref:Uncharacterized protein n=1 Tax=Campylobacter geochelonis TaxID=1780362 RepID=A0A128EGG3_9BACT|nr:hypothetical protein [Campylobacter geochelonis]QKF70873.1 hypothetical protein CGEO_0550 [Campylobacter geochelonis]CZE47970.1 Uncharacterised protein [Campylobacter geochelonis]CZE48868.1 Uncharacterised protein [Campylobacter geochelonis]CZE51367.1 Uncharacterised protein [Campylobacter geochelonis]